MEGLMLQHSWKDRLWGFRTRDTGRSSRIQGTGPKLTAISVVGIAQSV